MCFPLCQSYPLYVVSRRKSSASPMGRRWWDLNSPRGPGEVCEEKRIKYKIKKNETCDTWAAHALFCYEWGNWQEVPLS